MAHAGEPSRGLILVHGAWHGGWCWDEVVKGLAQKGYVAIAPALLMA